MEARVMAHKQKVWVLIKDNYELGIILRKIQERKQVECRIQNNGQIALVENRFCLPRALVQKNYNDMCAMEILNEAEILNNLSKRYYENQIYTSIGTTLVVINPYKNLPSVYSQDLLWNIRTRILNKQQTNNQKPHIFLTAGRAFQRLKVSDKRQSIIISGESGAGKTENTKYCMKFITTLSHAQIHNKNKSIEDIILQSNPILQQFGNCKTVKNNNSSRFGKFIRLFINQNAHITGTFIQNYLLQKSRVTLSAKNQRTFHVFYGLISNKYQKLAKLLPQDSFKYLSISGCMVADGINDIQNFQILLTALKDIGIQQLQLSTIFLTLGAILLLGNVQFDNTQNQSNPNINCSYKENSIIFRICSNLSITKPQIDSFLLQQKLVIGKQIMIKKYNKIQCQASRNTLSKALYGRIFDYLVSKINNRLSGSKEKQKSINILDIFGFQNFDHNGFEQLCINFTNQRLQKLYTKYIFENEIEQLKKDGLEDKIKYLMPPNNKQVIQLIQKRFGLSVFSLIDEKTALGSAKDQDIIVELRKIKNKSLHVDDIPNKTNFLILHTQSPVIYDVTGFKFKNQDSITLDMELFIDKLFPITKNNDQKGKTIVTKFDKQLRNLNQQLQSSQLHFVRCIKPNNTKSPMQIDQKYVLQQIKYMGILQTIQIRKNMFPFRVLYKSFIQYFKVLVSVDKKFDKLSLPEQCIFILRKTIPGIDKLKNSYQLGNIKIYLRQQQEAKLNELLLKQYDKQNKAALIIQNQIRRYKIRTHIKQALKLFLQKTSKLKSIISKYQRKIKYLTFIFYLKNIKQLSIDSIQQSKRSNIQKSYLTILKLEPILLKYQYFLFFLKIKYFRNQSMMYQTIPSYQTLITQEQSKEAIKLNSTKEHMSALSGISSYQSVIRNYDTSKRNNTIFKGQIILTPYDSKKCNLTRLRDIICHKDIKQAQINQMQQTWLSNDHNFRVDQSIGSKLLDKIQSFDHHQYLSQILKKKRTSFGRIKTVAQNLQYKSQIMGGSLLYLSPSQQKKALRIFKQLLDIGQQNDLQQIIKDYSEIITTLIDASQQLIDEIFIQLMKQQTCKNSNIAVKMLQTTLILLYVHQVSNNILLSGMCILHQRYYMKESKKQVKQIISILFPKILRQYNQKCKSQIKYIPIRFQYEALHFHQQIPLSIFFSVGKRIEIFVQYYQTFNDIKQKVRVEAGINSDRFIDEILTFVELFSIEDTDMKQNPIDDNIRVWDKITQWSITTCSLKANQNQMPLVILMMKVKHVFELQSHDAQGLQLVYSQCYFDLFIGKITLRRDLLYLNSAIVKAVHPYIRQQHLIPVWVTTKNQQRIKYLKQVDKIHQNIKGKNRMELYFQFIQNCEQNPMCMSLCFSTNSDALIFVKLKKIIIVFSSDQRQQISIRKIKCWDTIDDTFIFTLRQENQQHKQIGLPMRREYCKILSDNLLANMELILQLQGLK